jgi:hypothetical protein
MSSSMKKILFVTAFAVGWGALGFQVQEWAIARHKVRLYSHH